MPNYHAILTEFQDELARLVKDRDFVQKQIDRISKAIVDIQVLAQESDEPIMEPPPMHPDEEAGFTDRVRTILRLNPAVGITPVQIRDVLRKELPKDDPKVMLIHIHNTLKRLHRQEEIDEIPLEEGRAYRWKFPSANALAAVFARAPIGLGPIHVQFEPDKLPEQVRGTTRTPTAGEFKQQLEKNLPERKPGQAPIPPSMRKKNPAFYGKE
jgi:hypothetical protein